ncbi:hypothetical protein IFR05_002430 [Cadophora sp. M221]|nr:hypothetical protein IFR05_002430 [Cadophora sp. M221]
MKISFIVTLSVLVTAACAGGYQGCLERVWLFESFLIDQHNPVAEQNIGWQCKKWNNANAACEGDIWIPCKGRQGRSQCNFDDFQKFLGNQTPDIAKTLQAVYRADGSLDSAETAKKCLWAWRDGGKPVYNFRGHRAVRNGRVDHNDFIKRVGMINNDNYNKPAVRAAATDGAFRRVDDTLTKITQSRQADHGPHLIRSANSNLPGVTIIERDMGANPFYNGPYTPPATPKNPSPAPDTPRWKTVDFEATINWVTNPSNTRAQVSAWLDDLYRTGGDNSAKEHWQVLRSYKTMKDQTNRCRKH